VPNRFVSFAKLMRHLHQGMQREDLVVKFGHLTSQSFSSSSLQILAELVAVSENVSTAGYFFSYVAKHQTSSASYRSRSFGRIRKYQ